MSDPSEDYHETRYARQQEKLKQQARHARIVRQLGKSIVDQFEEGLIALPEPTPCIAAGVPSEWADWDEYPENREPQESRMPTASSCPWRMPKSYVSSAMMYRMRTLLP